MKLKMSFVAFAAAAFLAPALSWGDPAVPPPASATAPQTPQAISSAPASPEDVALVKRYFAAVKLDEMLNNVMASLIPAMIQDESKSIDGLTPERQTIISEVTQQAAKDWFPGYFDRMAEVYARVFSHDEIQALVTFYESPVGRSITVKSTTLAPVATQVMEESLPSFKDDIQKRLCQRIDCSKLKMKPTSAPS
jgi:hypothetical protein